MKLSDDRAQWLLLSAVIVSIGLGALVLLLNNAILSGHSATQAITAFPKNEIRDLRSNSINEAQVLGQKFNQGSPYVDGSLMEQDYINSYADFTSEYYNITLLHGGLMSVTVDPIAEPINGKMAITTVLLDIAYNDSIADYSEHLTLGIRG